MVKDNPNDKVYTPAHIVDEVLSHFGFHIEPQESIMEPFRGGGAFYNKLQEYSQHPVKWCEIDEGVDFFKTEEKVDWIVTNPPYSIFKEVLPKCLEVADNNILIIPVNKLLSSVPRLMDIKKAGHGIKEVYYIGSGRQLHFPFGFPVAAIHIQKGWDEGWYKESYHERCFKAKAK
ncbi:DNA methyltransferase [Vibrio phage 184E37-3b]|nr:hypothetical protein MYOV056v2_p0141 [Vibrio phage 184E37.3a]QZI87268.1 hypothetical protein MYOV085v1_p0250 [Vibrio phage 355E48.1]QZI90166.1 hypothetical protein MYOV057v1_p0251 [Vibrio phage 184E37.1]